MKNILLSLLIISPLTTQSAYLCSAMMPATKQAIKPIVETVAPVVEAIAAPIVETVAPVARTMVETTVQTVTEAAPSATKALYNSAKNMAGNTIQRCKTEGTKAVVCGAIKSTVEPLTTFAYENMALTATTGAVVAYTSYKVGKLMNTPYIEIPTKHKGKIKVQDHQKDITTYEECNKKPRRSVKIVRSRNF